MSSRRKELLKKILILKNLADLEKMDLEERKKKLKRKYWVNPFLAKRQLFNLEDTLLKDILWGEQNNFKNFMRLSLEQFKEL